MKHKIEISAGGLVYRSTQPFDKRDSGFYDQPLLWLITQHSQFKHWSFPKGLVGDEVFNESTEQAAIREVEEEGGVKAKIIQELSPVKYKYNWHDYLIDKTVYYYLMKYVSGDPKDHDWEVSEAKFVPKEEVIKTLTHDNDKVAFSQALDLVKNAGI